jgi:hypothetical protein
VSDSDRTPPGLRDRVWLTGLVAGLAGTVLVWVTLPHGRDIGSGWEYVARLAVFFCIIVAVALFPFRRPGAYVLLLLAFLVFAGYLFPRISWFYYGDTARAQADLFYTHLYQLAYPALILTVTAAYRLGGGSAGRCLKIAWTGVLIIFSGFLDIMWQVVNPVPIPPTIDAPHIAVFFGGPVSFATAVVFALAHVPIVVALNLLPLDRWIDRLLGPEPAPAAEPLPVAP